MTQTAPPGWYTDPSSSAMQRWWDGTAWTTETQPAPTTPALAPAGAGASSWTPTPVPHATPASAPRAAAATPHQPTATRAYAGYQPTHRREFPVGRLLALTVVVTLAAGGWWVWSKVTSPVGPVTYAATPTDRSVAGDELTITWSADADGNFVGSMTKTSSGEVESLPLSGSLRGTHLTLTFSAGVFGQETLFGEVHGKDMTLTVPQDDGTSIEGAFVRTSPPPLIVETDFWTWHWGS